MYVLLVLEVSFLIVLWLLKFLFLILIPKMEALCFFLRSICSIFCYFSQLSWEMMIITLHSTCDWEIENYSAESCLS